MGDYRRLCCCPIDKFFSRENTLILCFQYTEEHYKKKKDIVKTSQFGFSFRQN